MSKDLAHISQTIRHFFEKEYKKNQEWISYLKQKLELMDKNSSPSLQSSIHQELLQASCTRVYLEKLLKENNYGVD